MSSRDRLTARGLAWWTDPTQPWRSTTLMYRLADPALKVRIYRDRHRISRSTGPLPLWSRATNPGPTIVADGRGAAYRARQVARRRRNR